MRKHCEIRLNCRLQTLIFISGSKEICIIQVFASALLLLKFQVIFQGHTLMQCNGNSIFLVLNAVIFSLIGC